MFGGRTLTVISRNLFAAVQNVRAYRQLRQLLCGSGPLVLGLGFILTLRGINGGSRCPFEMGGSDGSELYIVIGCDYRVENFDSIALQHFFSLLLQS